MDDHNILYKADEDREEEEEEAGNDSDTSDMEIRYLAVEATSPKYVQRHCLCEPQSNNTSICVNVTFIAIYFARF